MADRLNGYRILILETREEAQFSRLLAEQGADVLQCPMFTIHDAPDAARIEAWIRRFIERPCDDLVLMTGEGLRRLMKAARRIDLERAFIAALEKPRKYARGPKPGRAQVNTSSSGCPMRVMRCLMESIPACSAVAIVACSFTSQRLIPTARFSTFGVTTICRRSRFWIIAS